MCARVCNNEGWKGPCVWRKAALMSVRQVSEGREASARRSYCPGADARKFLVLSSCQIMFAFQPVLTA